MPLDTRHERSHRFCINTRRGSLFIYMVQLTANWIQVTSGLMELHSRGSQLLVALWSKVFCDGSIWKRVISSRPSVMWLLLAVRVSAYQWPSNGDLDLYLEREWGEGRGQRRERRKRGIVAFSSMCVCFGGGGEWGVHPQRFWFLRFTVLSPATSSSSHPPLLSWHLSLRALPLSVFNRLVPICFCSKK